MRWLAATVLTLGALAWLASRSLPTGGTAAAFLARKERWAVKTGADDEAGSIAGPAVVTTVAELIRLERPERIPKGHGPRARRIGFAEHTIYTIDAQLIRYKCENDDGDDHLVITDCANPGPTMIVEIPDPEVVSALSPWRDRIAGARAAFDSAFERSDRFVNRGAHLRITGVGFFDLLHRQSGVAPNGIELHPVVGIEILH